MTAVSPESKIDEYGLAWISVETSGSSVYCRMPARSPLSATAFTASLTSSTLVSRAPRARALAPPPLPGLFPPPAAGPAAGREGRVEERAGGQGRADREAVQL